MASLRLKGLSKFVPRRNPLISSRARYRDSRGAVEWKCVLNITQWAPIPFHLFTSCSQYALVLLNSDKNDYKLLFYVRKNGAGTRKRVPFIINKLYCDGVDLA